MPSLEQVSKGSPKLMLMVLTLMPMLFWGGGGGEGRGVYLSTFGGLRERKKMVWIMRN